MAHSSRDSNVLRPMTRDDVPLGLRLSSVAGWNQTEADWQLLLTAGFGLVASWGSTGLGTVTVVPYGTAFSWIGMVLVDPAFRRRGVGTALLHRAMDEARPYGCIRLDATPQGRPLYESLGFRVEYELRRMVRPTGAGPGGSTAREVGFSGELGCTSLAPNHLSDVVAFDAPSFGAPRPIVLTELLARAPEYALACWDGSFLRGYCLGRSGARFEQIGPVEAEGEGTARTLLTQALAGCHDLPVIVDVPVDRPAWLTFLQDLGFQTQRPFTRMVLGCEPLSAAPRRQYAIAGPEMG